MMGCSSSAGVQIPRCYSVSCFSLSSMTPKPSRYHGADGLEDLRGASGRFMSTMLLFSQGILLILASLLVTSG